MCRKAPTERGIFTKCEVPACPRHYCDGCLSNKYEVKVGESKPKKETKQKSPKEGKEEEDSEEEEEEIFKIEPIKKK
jgi:hypothetical protein